MAFLQKLRSKHWRVRRASRCEARSTCRLGTRMKELPAGFPTYAVVEALESQWSFRVVDMEYVPVGFGAHHWRASTANAGELFVSVHELDLIGGASGDRSANFQRLRRALDAAHWLESIGGLEFVLGPVADRRGVTVHRVEDNYALHVYSWMECEVLDDPEGVRTGELVARLHGVTERLPPDLVREEDFEIPHRFALEDALGDLGVRWDFGTYAEAAREQLGLHEGMVRALLTYYDHLAELASHDRRGWAITHGEPRGANLVVTADGEVRMIDWDTALIAPRERDLWELPRDGIGQQRYASLVREHIDARWLRLYAAWYTLAELAVYLVVFRSPHTADQNVIQSWVNFLDYLPTRQRWPELSGERLV